MENLSSKHSLYSKRPAQEGEIDLRELFYVLWMGKWIILFTVIVSAAISIVYALSLPNIYRAEAVLAPVSSNDSRGLSALATQYGGLASLAGINLSGLGDGLDKTAYGIEVLRSRRFVGEFVERHDILTPLIASDGWELERNELVYDHKIYDIESREWVRQVDPPFEAVPSKLEAHEAFLNILSIDRDADTGFVKVGIEQYSPFLAKQWVDWLISDINTEIRQQDILEAESSIAYLSEQLKATSLAELQNIFYQLIEEQTKTIMLASARPEYLFRTVDPAVVTETKYKPKRALICIVGVIIGGFFGALFVLARAMFSHKDSPKCQT